MKNIASFFQAYFLGKPLYVHYGITHRCNLHCRMCHIQPGEDARELSLEQIDKIFTILKRLGVFYVSLGGGEPFLRSDLIPVVRLLKDKGFMVRLLTNGTLVSGKSVKDLGAAGLTQVSISLDTLNPDKFSHICASSGVWEKVMQAIDLFLNLPKKGRLLLINTVVSRLNIQELGEIHSFAKRKGYCVSFIPVEAGEASEFSFRENDHGTIDDIYEQLIEMKRGRNAIFNSSLFLEKSRLYLKTKQRNWRCDAGKLYFSVSPQGDISICHNFKPEGSLLKDGIEALLQLKDFRGSRQARIKECTGCMRPCWAEISYLFRDKKCLWEMAMMRISANLRN